MGLNIFTFDLQALINSLGDFFTIPDDDSAENFLIPDEAPPAPTDEMPPIAAIDSITSKILLSAAASDAAMNSIKPIEIIKSAPLRTENSSPKTASARSRAEDQKNMQELIKLLQTTVAHSYKSSDVVGGIVSFNTNNAFFKKNPEINFENDPVKLSEQKREQIRLEQKREELKKALLKNKDDNS